jgi:signal transduction histidine kinase
MRTHRPRPGPPRWPWLPRLPRRTARLRLTVLYGAAFLVCGAAVVALTYLLYGNTTHPKAPNGSGPGQAGPTTTLRIPAAMVQHQGRFDVINIPVSAIEQMKAVASPAVQARLLNSALVQVSYDKRQLLIVSGIALAVIAVGAAGIGWLIAGRVLRPLSTMTTAARRISASSLHERLALHGPDDELKELADTLDSLFARLEAAFEAQRRFAANASHELRTPLTRERTLLQVTLADPDATAGTWRAVSRELLASNAEQERLIEALLTLASSEVSQGDREPADLAAITSEALADARPGIDRLELNVQADIQPAVLDGDPLLVHQLAANLIDNAVRHNIPGGDIQVSTRTSQDGVVLSVTNSGQVIPADEVDRLFQPFQRFGPRTARRDGGHGLGLSIVKAIATTHTATITAQPRPAGGLAIEVTFPPPQPRRSRQTRRALPGTAPQLR